LHPCTAGFFDTRPLSLSEPANNRYPYPPFY
jgi:hypothetical protein